MKTVATVTGSIFALAVLYLLLWPVPIDPVAWQAPPDRGLVDPFESNERLDIARTIELGEHEGPEDVAIGPDRQLYATTEGGAVLRITAKDEISVFAHTAGRPLGIEFDRDGSLWVANAFIGLQRIQADGSVETLLSEIDGEPLVYANDLAVAGDGTVYFTQASSKFGAKAWGGTYPASLLDILEHGGHGQVVEFRPDSGKARVIIDDLNFANGIAISTEQDFLVISETGAYRILKHWLRGPLAGSTETLIDNLPGFPDNINSGLDGRFWIGLIAPRNALLDRLSTKPWQRKIVQRLPARFHPKAEPSSHVIAIDGNGVVLMNLQDAKANFPTITGVLETGGALYLTSLVGHALARVDKRDL